MNNKKIIHLIQSLDSGGCENMLLRTLPLLTDFEHIIITLKDRGELAEKFEKKNIKIINIGQRGFLDIVSYIKLIKIIKSLNPDIIITYLFHADMIGRLIIRPFVKKPIIPFLRTTHNYSRYWIARFLEKITKYFVKHYLANSESVKNFYVKNIKVSPEKITVIPNGIDIEFYDNIKRDENFRTKLGINPDETAVVCVANFYPNKGHHYLLEAFEEVYKINRKIKLLLVGDGKEKENLKKQTENYQSKNNILFLGRRSDVAKILKISDIFVLPTLFEGMSNAVMEAMSAGLPIVTTDIPENNELIKNNTTGVLVPAKNSRAICETMKNILENGQMKEKLSDSAKTFIQENFDLKKIAGQWNLFLNNYI